MTSDFYEWMLQRWREQAIPEWRKIRDQALDTGDKARAGYAMWMLKEVLGDSRPSERTQKSQG